MSEPVELQARITVKDGGFVFTNFAGQEFLIDTARNQLSKVLSEDKILDFIRNMLDRTAQDALVLSNLFGGRHKK
jgi:hypothetical protein